MEEINQKQTIENFAEYIIKKYDLDENILIDSLNNSIKGFWILLFQIILKKSEQNNPSNEIVIDNNINAENNFNKEELEKEIETFFNNNTDIDKEIWEKYKNGDIILENNEKRNSDILAPTSSTTDQKLVKLEDNEIKRNSTTNKRKKSVFINENKKFNFQIGASNKFRHQSIIAKIPNFHKIRLSTTFRNSISKNNKKFFNKKNKFRQSIKPNKNRKSLFLNVGKNTNFEYNSKRFFFPPKTRKSVVVPTSNFKFQYLNNTKKEKRKSSQFKSKEITEKKENDNIMIYNDESDSSSSINKNDTIHSDDNENSEKEDKNIIKTETNKFNENKNNNNNNINVITEEVKNEQKIEEEKKKIVPVYKNKFVFRKIYKKEKVKVKSLSQPKQKPKPKMYLNNKICHQINIILKAVINKNLKNKNSAKISPKKNKQNYDKTKEKSLNKNNKETKLNNKKEEIKKSRNKYNDVNNEIKDNTSYDKKEENIYGSNTNLTKKNILSQSSFKINEEINKSHLDTDKNLDKYSYSSNKHIKILKNLRLEESLYKPQTTVISKKAQIKYFKTNNNYNKTNYNKTNYKNKSYKNTNNKNTNYKNANINNKNNIGNYLKEIGKKRVSKNKENRNNENNSINKKNKKTYLQRYRDAIENIMKNDESIYNDQSDIFYNKKDDKTILKNGFNSDIKKKNGIKSELKLKEIKTQKKNTKSSNKIKKNIYSSSDNILPKKYKH